MNSSSHPNYELFEELGSSPVSTVMRAFDRQLERYVAIKILNNDASSDTSRRQRFLQEARFLANLTHPNVLPVFALEEAQAWMVMELMSASMKDRLNAGAVPLDIAKSVLAQTFEALKYIHGLGRVHASIRPSNILISDTGMVKLSDFSDRRPEDGLDAPAPNLSKYVPPEVWNQSQFGPIGTTIDFYSLGITIIECLAGKPLEQLAIGFNRQNSPEIEWARWHTSPEHEKAITELVKNIPKALRSLVEAMLKQKASDRPQSANELIGLLGATKLVAVDIPLDAESPKSSSSPQAFAQSPFPSITTPTASSATATSSPAPSTFNKPSLQPKAAPLFQPAAASKVKLKDQPNGKPGFDLNNPKTFRIVAGVTLGLAAVFGLILQGLMSPTIPKTPVAIFVEPREAQVTVNGKPLKLKDGQIDLNLAPEEYALKATLEGYDPVEEALKIELPPEGEEISKIERKIQLLQSEQRISLVVEPPDVEILVDGKMPSFAPDTKGKETQIMLRPGRYEFSLAKEGYASNKVQQVVKQDTKQLQFEPMLVEFTITVDPADAKVEFADGKPVAGRKNVFAVGPGKHQIKVAYPGFETSTQVIDVSVDNRRHDVFLSPMLVQFDMTLPSSNIEVECDGQKLLPNANGRYSLKSGENTLAFRLGAPDAQGESKAKWEQRISVEPNMPPVVVEIPESIAKMSKDIRKKGNPTDSKLKNVVVRVYPVNNSNLKLVLDGNPVELVNGEANVPYAELRSDRKAVELKILRDNHTEFEEFISRESLESQGEVATVNHSFSLSDKERARRLWLFARTAVKSFPKEAIEALDEALELDPTLATAYRERAIAKNELDLVSDAEEDVVKALNDLPNDYATLSVGGIVASKMFLKTSGAAETANFSLAANRLNQAIERYPKRTSARMMRSQLLYWAGNKKGAEEDLVALLRLTREPDQLSYVKSQLGTIATDAGNIDSAIQLFDEAIEIRKSAELSTTVPQFNKAKAILEHARRAQKEDANKARKFFEMAKSELLVLHGRKDVPFLDFLAMLGEIEATLGNYQTAINAYSELINNGGMTPIILKNRAAAYDAIGDKKSAEADRAKAAQLQKQ